MANFRDAHPRAAAVFFCLFLLVCRPSAVRAQIPVSGGFGANIGQLASLFTGGAGSASTTSQIGSLLGNINPLNPLNLPALNNLQLPTAADIPAFTQDAIKTILGPVMNLATPPELSPEVDALLKSADGGDPSAIATLGLLSSIFLLVSSILFTVSSSLGVGAASVGVLSAGLGTITGPINWLLSADQFQLQVRSDLASSGDKLFNQWADGLTAITDRLGSINGADAAKQLAGARAQLAQARDMFKTAAGKFIGGSS